MFAVKVDNDPDKLHILPSAFYQQLFGGRTESYIGQARMMLLHSLLTSPLEPPPEEVVLAMLCRVHRENAITLLIAMHNQGYIELNHMRFRPLAHDLGICFW